MPDLQGSANEPGLSTCAEDRPSKRVKVSGDKGGTEEAFADALTSFWSESGEGALSSLLDEKVVWHDSLLQGRDLSGLDQLQALRSLLRGAFPDLRVRLAGPLEAGEQGLLLGYWTAEGSHTGPLGPSLPPSRAAAAWEGSVLVRTVQRVAAAAGPGAQAQGAARGDREGGGGTAAQKAPTGHDEGQHTAAGGEPAADAAAAPAAAAAAAPGAGAERVGVEVWWSWDPIFLFRQLGWKEGGQRGHGEGGGEAVEPSTRQTREPAQLGEVTAQTSGQAAAAAAVDDASDAAARTAAAARAAYGSEADAAAAAEAAVAAAAAAEGALAAAGGASSEALAAAQAANRAVVELYFHTYNTGHYAVLDHIVHRGYTYGGLIDLGGRVGVPGMLAMMGGWRDTLPDLVIGHEAFAAVGADKVTFRWIIRGTHAAPAPLLGVPGPSGARLLVKGVTTLTLAGGRIARKVSHANAAHTLQQLGAAAHPVVPLP